MKKIQVVLAEDRAMVRGALAALLETEPNIAVCAPAANGREALIAIAKQNRDVLVTDIEMPEMTGLTLAGEVQNRFPKTKVVILTTFNYSGEQFVPCTSPYPPMATFRRAVFSNP
jgi:two-component system, NarL family, response regulator DesR